MWLVLERRARAWAGEEGGGGGSASMSAAPPWRVLMSSVETERGGGTEPTSTPAAAEAALGSFILSFRQARRATIYPLEARKEAMNGKMLDDKPPLVWSFSSGLPSPRRAPMVVPSACSSSVS